MAGDGGSLPTFSVPLPTTGAFLPRRRRQRSGVSRDPCKHKQLSESRAPLAGSTNASILTNTLGRWHCRGDSNPCLPRLLLPDAAPEMSPGVLSSCCPCPADGNKSQGTPGCKGPANQRHACVGRSFHTALSPGLKLFDGTEGREEEEGECSEHRPISALGGCAGAALPPPGLAASREGGCVTPRVTGTNIELQSHSCPRRLCGVILLAQPLLLGFLFPICFPPRDVPRFDFQGQFPQGFLSQVVAEVVEE